MSSLAPLKSSSIDVQSDFKIPKSKLHHHHSPQYMHQSQALSPENANIPTNLESPRGLHISTKSERPKTLAIPTNLESPTDLHSQDQKRSEGSDSEDMDSEDSMGNSLGVEMVAPLAKLVSIQQQIVVCAPLPSTLVYNRVKHMGFVGGEAVQLTCHQTQSTRE